MLAGCGSAAKDESGPGYSQSVPTYGFAPNEPGKNKESGRWPIMGFRTDIGQKPAPPRNQTSARELKPKKLRSGRAK